MDFNYQSVHASFMERFQKEPMLVRSPGRINLIGEHTDYNDGFVMPAAIDKEIIFAAAPSSEKLSKIYALNFDELLEVDLNNPQPVKSPSWANYILGVARQFVDRGITLKSVSCVFGGNIPSGAGMSSSAALEGGFAFLLQEVNKTEISRIDLAKIGQWSEHNFVGVRCGIMDQFANMMGKEDHVIQLDCRSLEYQHFPLRLKDYSLVLFNSGVKHSLASSEYNVRRNECEEGVQLLKKKYPSIMSLRDASVDMLEACEDTIPQNVFDRCKYVIEETERVQRASEDLRRNDLSSFGKKMNETHWGLSKLYKVSCDELDYLASLVQKNKDALGARMMGGGFGGCTINILHNNGLESVIDLVGKEYRNRFNVEVVAYKVKIKDGVGRLSIS